jgi:hypothetical protein
MPFRHGLCHSRYSLASYYFDKLVLKSQSICWEIGKWKVRFCLWVWPVNSLHCQALSWTGRFAFGRIHSCTDRRRLWRLYWDTTAENRILATTVQCNACVNIAVFLFKDWFPNPFRYGEIPVKKKFPPFWNSNFLYSILWCQKEVGPLSLSFKSMNYVSRIGLWRMEERCQCGLKHAARQFILYGSLTGRSYSYHRMWLGSFSNSVIISNVFHHRHEGENGSLPIPG